MMTFTPLTREQFATLTEQQRTTRRAHWAGIIRGLQADHDRRYHSAARATELRRAS